VTSGNLSKAAEKADIIIGVSQKDLFTEEIVTRMNKNPIVFALANPAPEVTEKDAIKWGTAVYANGRSDCTNQINNALVFPGFFKGLLKYRIRNISMEMKVNAALAISSLVSMPTQKFFMPSILNKKLVKTILASFK
jgi:malate dehydrogenase (oxaloacetate-decarboxylating)